ncbi:uncharacterized protein EDB91DRAFT_218233 [Suillus paluster]|uniref:uncharacterized protein n=1 Tax=Suillus paluster TaxID=48578 RepID=UPI001B873A17|nr:uncharacterized protein EDB91DRAFT_218233 [Suillus paluster]KAG1743625.1 hypothetical protein EDB91DRAFT_218233 [Suillus paluster]
MAPKLHDDDIKHLGNAPPSYDTISMSASADSVNFKRPLICSFLPMKQKRVLSCIRDIVLAPNFPPSSAAPTINACAAALPAARFSDLLQTSNVEGHTALYWAIVNNRREAFLAFAGFISELSSGCSSDLRLACIATSDHASFTQLNLGNSDANEEVLRRSLGCPPDEVRVNELVDQQFVASFRVRLFQKRLRITKKLSYEFVAGGRIWFLRFYMDPKWRWRVGFGLSPPSFPARPKGVLLIEAHAGKGDPGSEIPPQGLHMASSVIKTLVPDGPDCHEIPPENVAGRPFIHHSWELGDWVMFENPIYVDCDSTLHAKLEITCK